MTLPITRVQPDNTALLVVDVQEKLFPHLDRADAVAANIGTMIAGVKLVGLPIVATEQYPTGLGRTIDSLRRRLGDKQQYHPKTTFSCLGDPQIQKVLANVAVTHWILVGIEAHVCILQTAKDLLAAGKHVVVPNDCITSRSIYDFSTAIAEMRDYGVRISSLETLLFELTRDAKAPQFKQISALVK